MSRTTPARGRAVGRVLVANRGEIAARIIRACRDEGVGSVACFAEPDADAPYLRLADTALPLGASAPDDTYLSIDRMLEAAARSGADAVHPGYGFLSEDPRFAHAVSEAGLTWIGPPAPTLEALGDKVTARRIAEDVGAPLLPGTREPVSSTAEIERFARQHGMPVVIKAAFGGGGRGMRVVRSEADIAAAFDASVREATAAFGRGDCFVERFLDRARHVEAQVLADQHGSVVVVGTRDCSLQRRHQKLVEEAPAPFLSDAQTALVRTAARDICRAASYEGAGTVEFLLGDDGTIAFLEVNARIQVEHPVTEETSGVDLVRQQIRIAAGRPLNLPEIPPVHGHAIEFRINCEDPTRGFVPTPGTVEALVVPQGPGVRLDSGIAVGSTVTGRFDSLVAKLVVTGADREQALQRAGRALDEIAIGGLTTTIPFHRAVVCDPAFVGGSEGFAVHTGWIESESGRLLADGQTDEVPPATSVSVVVGRETLPVDVPAVADLPGEEGERLRTAVRRPRSRSDRGPAGATVVAPMQGNVTQVLVADGTRVDPGDVVAVVEAMKMENAVRAHRSGSVHRLRVSVGDTVAQDDVICDLS